MWIANLIYNKENEYEISIKQHNFYIFVKFGSTQILFSKNCLYIINKHFLGPSTPVIEGGKNSPPLTSLTSLHLPLPYTIFCKTDINSFGQRTGPNYWSRIAEMYICNKFDETRSLKLRGRLKVAAGRVGVLQVKCAG